ncbi:MAG: SDR family oxidoreductase [Negativicutes bacterium]|nr:SDR family oxidoreductase [Negativicutes bacterium]
MKKALITGITGQDGSYLAEFLLDKGYEVHGIVRRSSFEDENKLNNIKNIRNEIELHVFGLEDQLNLYRLIQKLVPDECYHLAASSFVSYDFNDEASIFETNFNATHRLLASIKEASPQCRFFLAGSSEMFGDADSFPQEENHRFCPRSIYGVSKVAAHHVLSNYRRHYGLYACTGITYNHESPRRGSMFLSKKITSGVARIYTGLQKKLELGNLDACRDWGYAPDYVEAMWLMLNKKNQPEDYVIATGELHSVRDMLSIAFGALDMDYKQYVTVNKQFVRPAEAVALVGNARKIYEELGWKPRKKFADIIRDMVMYDLKCLRAQ